MENNLTMDTEDRKVLVAFKIDRDNLKEFKKLVKEEGVFTFSGKLRYLIDQHTSLLKMRLESNNNSYINDNGKEEKHSI